MWEIIEKSGKLNRIKRNIYSSSVSMSNSLITRTRSQSDTSTLSRYKTPFVISQPPVWHSCPYVMFPNSQNKLNYPGRVTSGRVTACHSLVVFIFSCFNWVTMCGDQQLRGMEYPRVFHLNNKTMYWIHKDNNRSHKFKIIYCIFHIVVSVWVIHGKLF